MRARILLLALVMPPLGAAGAQAQSYTIQVLVAGDKAPKKFSRAYAKALKGEEGALDKLSYADKTIVFEHKGDGYEATSDGAGVVQKDLEELARKAGNGDEIAAMFSAKAVKVGDTWPIAKEAFRSLLSGLKE